MVGEVVWVGLELDERLDGGEDDGGDAVALLLVDLDELCVGVGVQLIFIWFSSLMMKLTA
jgi:hypothetical protein